MAFNNKQKQLIFDYSIGLGSEEQQALAKELITSNEEAAEIHKKVKSTLAPLEEMEVESCPDELVEQTVALLQERSSTSQVRLEELLFEEEHRGSDVKSPFLQNVGKVLASAAVILFFAGVFFSFTEYMQNKSFQQRCQMHLGRIYRGLQNYMSEHNSQLPAVATTEGQPWWKVGSQGSENVSNTRHIWLLVKKEYVEPDQFICPGKKTPADVLANLSQIQNHNDFPTRGHITYSFRIRCPKSKSPAMSERRVLIADMNPLFEKLPKDYTHPLNRRLDKKLAHLNSSNHNGRGQNVLFTDGSTQFIKSRHTDISNDDIFTLRDTEIYKGVEVPTCEEDAFLAP